MDIEFFLSVSSGIGDPFLFLTRWYIFQRFTPKCWKILPSRVAPVLGHHFFVDKENEREVWLPPPKVISLFGVEVTLVGNICLAKNISAILEKIVK